MIEVGKSNTGLKKAVGMWAKKTGKNIYYKVKEDMVRCLSLVGVAVFVVAISYWIWWEIGKNAMPPFEIGKKSTNDNLKVSQKDLQMHVMLQRWGKLREREWVSKGTDLGTRIDSSFGEKFCMQTENYSLFHIHSLQTIPNGWIFSIIEFITELIFHNHCSTLL